MQQSSHLRCALNDLFSFSQSNWWWCWENVCKRSSSSFFWSLVSNFSTPQELRTYQSNQFEFLQLARGIFGTHWNFSWSSAPIYARWQRYCTRRKTTRSDLKSNYQGRDLDFRSNIHSARQIGGNHEIPHPTTGAGCHLATQTLHLQVSP